MAQFLASLISMNTSYVPNTYVIFAIYVAILLLHGVVNSMAVRLNGLFNNISGKMMEQHRGIIAEQEKTTPT